MRLPLLTSAVVALAGSTALAMTLQDPQVPQAIFRSSVDRVAVATVVKTRQGRPVLNLTKADFQLTDAGRPWPIAEVRTESSPVNVALLVDFSGSMDVALKREASREMAGQVLQFLTAGTDQVGLYAFDKQLTELSPLGPAPGNILNQLRTVRPFGVTSLFDAVAQTGRAVAAKGGARRAVVALTDGIDNASALSPEQVSALAASIDVPVYIVIIVSPLDRSDNRTIDDEKLNAQMTGQLANLAHWTGGEIFAAIGPESHTQAARQIVTELRQQYLVVFEPDHRPGWHPIEIKTRQRDHVVRARSGYVVSDRPQQR